jgi:hypothetical protein
MGKKSRGKREILIGIPPKELNGNGIYVDISSRWEGVNIEVRSNEPFLYQHKGEITKKSSRYQHKGKIKKSTEITQFFEYPINLRQKTPVELNNYFRDIHERIVRVGNFLVTLAEVNNATIHSYGTSKEIKELCGGLEKLLERAKPHLKD